MFKKVLIANRGEIACRISRTCQRLGIQSVAVGSIADQNAQHMKAADEAIIIGPAEAQHSYLKMEAIINAAKSTGAEAIHPGYGFLAENPEFAELVLAHGLTFIGPSPHAIRVMGEKGAAKRVAIEEGIPVVPGGTSHIEIGYPLIIKAAYGGGGKGMRIVRSPHEFNEALESARREGASAFGNDSVILERYIDKPRHIEVQILGDHEGHVVTLGERDCSMQRRHQKIIEEAPAAQLDLVVRHKLHEDAIKLAKAVSYRNAGTVEFLVDEAGNYYFLEMNTRLQVEHPVTEMIYDIDLVEWQLRIASGEKLSDSFLDPQPSGHAIEVRLNAEDTTTFLPASGTLTALQFPHESNTLRVDTGFQSGDEITIHYDSLLAKIIAWGESREAALARMSRALTHIQVEGVKTNLGLLKTLLRRPDFREHPQDTHYLQDLMNLDEPQELAKVPVVTELVPPFKPPLPSEALILASLWIYLNDQAKQQAASVTAAQASSPWFSGDAWRLNTQSLRRVSWENAPDVFFIQDERGLTARVNEDTIHILAHDLKSPYHIWAILNEKSQEATLHPEGRSISVIMNEHSHIFIPYEPLTAFSAQIDQKSHLTAPMPGRVIQILVGEGEIVDEGAPLLILEAMKMEHTIRAPQAGRIREVFYAPGDFVDEGLELVSMEEL